jgi:nucleotide-binding universal stress UspA family protein
VYKTIVVGTDGSDSAAKAVRRATELAAAHGALLRIVTAMEPIPARRILAELEAVPAEQRFLVDLEKEAEDICEAAAAEARAAGVEVDLHPLEGDPAAVILTIAEQYEADLIVIGNKGMVGTGRFLLGSVPNKVSHHAPCDLLIVKTT